MNDFWNEMAGTVPDEAPVYEDFPIGVWAHVRIAGKEDGGWAAEVVTRTAKKTGEDFHAFRVGLIPVGAEAGKTSDSNRNGRIPFDSITTAYGEDALHGKLVGLFNAAFSAGIEDKADRWKNTLGILKGAADELQVTAGEYPNIGTFLAVLGAHALAQGEYYVLAKTRKNKVTEKVEAGSVEEATPENVAKRNIAPYEKPSF